MEVNGGHRVRSTWTRFSCSIEMSSIGVRSITEQACFNLKREGNEYIDEPSFSGLAHNETRFDEQT